MLITYPGRAIVIPKKLPYLAKKNDKKFRSNVTVASQNSSDEEQKTSLKNRFSNPTILVQSGIAVLGLGFIDAGYSGDWSRIGVISKETEDLLRLLAFFVVPLCFFLIYSLSKKTEV